jgi:hypothetical protein
MQKVDEKSDDSSKINCRTASDIPMKFDTVEF